MEAIYDAKLDPEFQNAFIDIDKQDSRKLPDGTEIPLRYIHGGFEGTAVRFSFFYPEKERYEGRFYQYLSPFPGPDEEIASISLTGGDDKIAFALTHGAYFVETNMGSAAIFTNSNDNTMTHRSSAAAAEYSRKKAREVYGYEHRPYGYVYGGSGGGYRTMACIENTNAWDGAVPYIIGSPYAIPNCHTTRVHAMRILRHKMDQIADAMDAGGSGDPYEGLNEEEAAALREAELFGCPLRSWFSFRELGDGAVPVLLPGVKRMDPDYFEDFWKVPGYLGAEPDSNAVRDRIKMTAHVRMIYIPEKKAAALAGNVNGADTAWLKMLSSNMSGEPWIELDQIPVGDDLYLTGVQILVKTGAAEGKKLMLDHIEGSRIYLSKAYGVDDIPEVMELLQTGDEVLLDNSDYIAFQTYHRHQVPSKDYHGWDQFRDAEGEPLYPQQKKLVGPIFSSNGPGCKQNGLIQGKVIIVASLMDESAYAWQADWYRRKIASVHEGVDERELCRLWYVDHSLHDDRAETIDELHVTSYLGALRQALLDVAQWVENGTAPLPSSEYEVNIGQMSVPETAVQRKGIQPVVTLLANGSACAHVKCGEQVAFLAEAEVPDGAGSLTHAEWSFEGDPSYPDEGELELTDNGQRAVIRAEHTYDEPGTYFAVIRVSSERNGEAGAFFTQVRNLERVRVIVD
ncbi:MAG: PKD domain-containing protein [Schaedlerella sp.]|uniref:hypothetical protein n=1 Tax=Schaedlerella sp. TaxID=2676057 RepID=UPI0035289D26